MIKLNLGCGKDHKKGFINCDIVKEKGVDLVMDCADLSRFKDDSVDLVFCHSFFEHLFLYQQFPFLEHCKRVLNDNGYLVILGIPDFEKIARLYLAKVHSSQAFDMPFNLYQAYRLTHGDYEDGKQAYIPQLHKALFDKKSLAEIFLVCGYSNTRIFSYVFPKENQETALGVVAFKGGNDDDENIKKVLSEFKSYFEDFGEVCEFL